MKTITNMICVSLGSAVQEVATRTSSEALGLGLSFRIFLGARWGFACEAAAVFLEITFLAERWVGISVKMGTVVI